MKQFLTHILPLAYGKLFNFLALFNTTKAAKWSFKVFCTIRKGRVAPEQRNFLDAAKLPIEQVEEHQIQSYQWKGEGATILLIHGWESNAFRWRNLIQKLQEHNFNIIAFDAPAHGNSSGTYLHVPLYSVSTRYMMEKHRPTAIVAHSVGGMTTLFDHYKNPRSSVEKIVTIGAPCEFSDFMDHYQQLTKFNDRVRKAMDVYLKSWLGFHFHEFSSLRFVANNRKQGMLFHDTEDKQVSYSASKKVHEHWKGSQLITTTGLGHSMHQEKVNKDIVAFLNS